jgi:hypothetical protein
MYGTTTALPRCAQGPGKPPALAPELEVWVNQVCDRVLSADLEGEAKWGKWLGSLGVQVRG